MRAILSNSNSVTTIYLERIIVFEINEPVKYRMNYIIHSYIQQRKPITLVSSCVYLTRCSGQGG